MKRDEHFAEAFETYRSTYHEIVEQITQYPESYFCKWIYLYYKKNPALMSDQVHAFLYHYIRRSFLQGGAGALTDKELLEREEAWERKGVLSEKGADRYGALALWLADLLRAWNGNTEHHWPF